METAGPTRLRNFRDASGPGRTGDGAPLGYETGRGSTMKRGRVFRSDNATALDHGDTRALAELRLARAFDLRSASERRRVPSVFSTLGTATDVSSFEDLTSFNEGELAGELLSTLVRKADVSGLMLLYYRQLPGVFAGPLATIFAHLADSDEPVVVHCRGGKDRTGFAVAMLHRAIGVSADDALADYLRSAGLFEPGPEEEAMLAGIARRTGVRLEAETLAPMMTVSAGYLGAAFETIDARFGGIEAYLRDACDLSDARRERLAMRLTEFKAG